MTKRIKITNAADVRPGDMVKMHDDEGHTWRGKAWASHSDWLHVGTGDRVRYPDGEAGEFFVHATRKVPKPQPLPTTVGTVLIATVRGVEGVQVMRTDDGDRFRWVSSTRVLATFWHADADITDWTVIYAPGESK